MKKFILVGIAAIMALGLSAFTPKKTSVDLYYKTGPNTFVPYTFPNDPCPPDEEVECWSPIDGTERQIFYTPSENDPFLTLE